MTYKITVPEMHCEHCVARIQTALKSKGLNFNVSLDTKTVTLDGCEHCLSTTLETLDDLGFSGQVEE